MTSRVAVSLDAAEESDEEGTERPDDGEEEADVEEGGSEEDGEDEEESVLDLSPKARPVDRAGQRITQQKDIVHAWPGGPRIDEQYFYYVQEDYARRQAAVDAIRERIQELSRPGSEFRVKLVWNCRSLTMLFIRRHFSWTPCVIVTLPEAVWDGDILLVHSVIFRSGMDGELYDRNGQYILNIAIQQNHEAITRLLLDRETDVNAQDEGTGRAPLHMAVIMGNLKLVKRLLKRGADANCEDEEGLTAFMWAAVRSNLEIMELLFSKKVDANHQDVYGATALHLACFQGSPDVIEFLLRKAKVRRDVEDSHGFVPFLYARFADQEDAMRQLDDFEDEQVALAARLERKKRKRRKRQTATRTNK